MKKFTAILFGLLLAAQMTATAFAADEPAPLEGVVSTTVLKGTPVIDGELDDMYIGSAEAKTYDENKNVLECNFGDLYFLWDDTYLYCCCVCPDKTVVGQCQELVDQLYWADDCVEIWFSNTPARVNFSIHASGFHQLIWPMAGLTQEQVDTINYVSNPKPDEEVWTVEMAIPLSLFGGAVDTQFTMCYQVINVSEPDFCEDIRSWCSNNGSTTAYTLSSTYANGAKQPDTQQPADDTTAAPDTQGQQDDPVTPVPTAQPIVAGSALAALAAAAVATLKKRK